jgi:hypothetical protein
VRAKIIIAGAALALLAGAVIVGTWLFSTAREQGWRDSMVRVVRENREAAKRGGFLGYHFEARKIATTGCPDDFRIAWMQYMQALERQAPVKSFARFVLNPRKFVEEKDEVTTAWHNLEAVCLRHEVQLVQLP